MAYVEVESVSKSYTRREGLRRVEMPVVRNVSLVIERGETLGLVGESGSGKSTLARMVLGLVAPTEGVIRVADVVVGGRATQGLRRQMQPVFQDPAAALDPRMRVVDLVTEPLVIHRHSLDLPTDKTSLRRAARELLHSVGMDESALDRYPHQFSGGQKQRINIARALALRPAFLVLDEPVSALDVSVGAQVINLLRSLQRDLGLTYLFISHSMPLVRYLSTSIAVMEQGAIVETGEAEAICAAPREDYTRRLVAATPEM
uniref:ABC transporter, ATPase subunit n=1 Tax=mine drainage metagenome TaxID=410659 RepID=E6PYN1_9ZZZZ